MSDVPSTTMAKMEALAKAQRRQRGRTAQKVGAGAQAVVHQRLVAAGYLHVCPIETGWSVRRAFNARTGTSKIVGATPVRKVAGDFRAVQSGTGRSVLCETKWRPDVLEWSDLETHQVANLNEHLAAGGISLLAWVSRAGATLYTWPVPGFGPGTSLKQAVRA